MAKEYKFMFDRRFDDPEGTNPGDQEDMSSVSVDGIPSISQLLDTINIKTQDIFTKEETPEEQSDNETHPPSPAAEEKDQKEEEKEEEKEKTEDLENAEENVAAPQPENNPSVDIQEPVAVEPVKEEPPPAPAIVFTHTDEEMEDAKNKAREVGRLAGQEQGRESAWQEAMASIEKQNSDTLTSIDSSIKELLKISHENAQTVFTTAVDFALAVCRKALPSLAEANALTEIRDLLEKNLHFLKDEPKISLRLNPLLADKIKPMLTDLVRQEAYGGKIAVVRDDTLPAGDCRVEWKNGGLEKNMQEVLNHTEELVKLYAHAAPADHNGEE